jgi:predicted heme/steroid binding protein
MRRSVSVLSVFCAFSFCSVINADTIQQPAVSAVSEANNQADSSDSLKKMTVEELAKFNGKDGASAYVAINDTIYDVTGVKSWRGGKHNGNNAGMDLSAKIKRSPHGTSVLKKLKVVGVLQVKK